MVVVVVVVLLLVSPPGEALSSRSDCKLAMESWADEQQRLLHLQQEAAVARRSQLQPGLLYFLHVPRTGGRTFYQCLLRNLYPKEHRCPHSYDKLRVDPKHPDCKLLTTHDDYSILTKLSREITSVVTNLRHPLNRVLSTYEFSIEVAARFLRTATNESSNGVESRDSQEKSSETSHVSTLDIWPWKYLVPFMRDDLLKRRGARNAKMMDTPQDIQNSYNVSSIAMPLDEFIQRREAFELMHNGLTFQVAGLTNTSSLEEAKELRLCIQQYPELGIHALQVAKERLSEMLYVGLTERSEESVTAFASIVGTAALPQLAYANKSFTNYLQQDKHRGFEIMKGQQISWESSLSGLNTKSPSTNLTRQQHGLLGMYNSCVKALRERQTARKKSSLKHITPINYSAELRKNIPYELEEEILQLNNLDVKLYEHAVNIFEKQQLSLLDPSRLLKGCHSCDKHNDSMQAWQSVLLR